MRPGGNVKSRGARANIRAWPVGVVTGQRWALDAPGECKIFRQIANGHYAERPKGSFGFIAGIHSFRKRPFASSACIAL